MTGMKQFAITFLFFVIALSPLAAACQASGDSPLPQNPSPAADSTGAQTPPSQPGQQLKEANPQISDREWFKIQKIAHGEPIIVASTYGPPLYCRFASATETALYCDSPNSPDGTGYRIDRRTVMYVELEIPKPAPNRHPVWISSMIAGGILVGFAATQDTSDGHAAADGAIGALIVGVIGAPLAMMNSNNGPAPVPVIYGSRAMISLPLRKPRLPHGILPILR